MDAQELRAMLNHDERHWWYRGRRRILAGELDRLQPASGSHLLDAGCGSGRTLDELSRFGRVSGIDASDDAVAAARARGHADVVTGMLESLPWDAGTFDLATCLDVIEHTVDDRATLRELRRVVRPGGHLLVTVPAYQALWSNHDIVNRHLRRYSRRMLRSAATDAGWTVERMTSFNSMLLAPAALVRVAQRVRAAPVEQHTSDLERTPRWLDAALEQPLRAEAAWLGGGRSLPAGLSLLALLRR